MDTIKIGGREIPLFYSTYESIAIMEDIGCTAFQMKDEVFGIRQEDEDDPTSIRLEVVTDPKKTKKLGTLIRILGNAGLEENGEAGDLTDKWVLRHMKPPMIMPVALIALKVVVEGNKVEAPADENSGPVDLGLEEEQAKKQPGN